MSDRDPHHRRQVGHGLTIVRAAKACYGCRACELVCSFHFRGLFAPGGGAIKVWKRNSDADIAWTVDSSCDGCAGEKGLLCVRYCTYKALSVAPQRPAR